MNSFILSNRVSIPCIGYGTLNIEKGNNIKCAISKAIEVGYRHFDSAEVYGNDENLGKIIENSQTKREDVFITSKLSNDNRGYENTIKSFEETLKRTGLDYLDLYLIHWPLARGEKLYCDKINIETWQALEYLYQIGKVRAIGVSNFLEHHLEPVIKNAKIIPMVNQLEIHPGQPQTNIVNYCKKNNIQVEAWGPLASGKALNHPILIEISKKYKKTVAQICIKWCLQQNIIPLPKTVNIDRMRENLDVFDFEITNEDIKIINEIPYFAGSGLNPDEILF